MGTIDALVESRSPLAIAPLERLLGSPAAGPRAAAADGLGRLGARQAAGLIEPLLANPNYVVRFAAAGALYRLGDTRGQQILTDAAGSTICRDPPRCGRGHVVQPGSRLADSRAPAHVSRGYRVRLGAARLLAPYDAAAANATLARLLDDTNASIRVGASRVLAGAATDFSTLRQLLHRLDPLMQAHAANRILELTR